MTLHPLHIADCDSSTPIPERMNNPFDYTPHPLCIQACHELQAHLAKRDDWREEIGRGKMFGVLIVEKQSQIGYLAAYSGQIGGRSDWEGFVPAVYDYLQPDGYFKTHEAEITRINEAIERLERDDRMREAKRQIAEIQAARSQAVANYQKKMREAKAKRDAKRMEIQRLSEGKNLSTEEKLNLEEEVQALVKESQFMKAELRRLKKSLAEKTTLEKDYDDYQEDIAQLKRLRKQLSDALQQWLFSQFRMTNAKGERKDLLEIFSDYALQGSHPEGNRRRVALKSIPPAGSGECCEPKLLQYAYEQGYHPLQMAMFWWGESPKEEIRHHLHFYPACNGKCKPILQWMLPETDRKSDESKGRVGNQEGNNPIDNKVENNLGLEILYEDREVAVICKPAGMLSVPGKDANLVSVHSLMRKKYPDTASPLIVHRLDMATSGLMVIAKTDFAYHRLQAQFANHQVRKRYVAIVGCTSTGIPMASESFSSDIHTPDDKRKVICLPLMPDYLDRPRQIVSHEHGKEALTEWEFLGEVDPNELPEVAAFSPSIHYYRLALYPLTGRTHQLRVHCAHQEGLGAPILGDPLYGNVKASRLYLHAEEITFIHPLTGKEIHIGRKAGF